jgi:hypothetical protein
MQKELKKENSICEVLLLYHHEEQQLLESVLASSQHGPRGIINAIKSATSHPFRDEDENNNNKKKMKPKPGSAGAVNLETKII